MTPRNCREELTSLVVHLMDIGAALDYNSVIERRGGGVVLVEQAGSSPLPYREFGNVEEYMDVIRLRQFACLLFDGGAIQVAYTFKDDVVIRHRLCFHPCPVVLARDEVELIGEELGLSEIVDLCLDQNNWRNRLRLRSPLRFDYHEGFTTHDHSASHLHVSHGTCRIPVFGPVSIGHFVRIIFRHFYPELWASDGRLREWRLVQLGRSILTTEECELFVECRST
jgi:hypothetical protein